MPIYTRKGDKGETSLFGGKRVLKTDIRVEAYGTIDELDSTIGVGISFLPKNMKKLKKELHAIQYDLLTIGSSLANPRIKGLPTLSSRVVEFEKMIDKQTAEMPVLKNFIFPGGSSAAAFFHLARTICRRAERRIVSLSQTDPVPVELIKYINRLSDLLFSTARYVNFKEKTSDIVWNPS